MGLTPSFRNATDYIIPEDMPLVKAPSLCFGLELDSDRCKGKKNGLDALIQAIFMQLSTEKGLFIIYPDWYGLQTHDLYGRPTDYVFAELSARIKDCLMQDDRIEDVTNFALLESEELNAMRIAYTVNTSMGDLRLEGVLN